MRSPTIGQPMAAQCTRNWWVRPVSGSSASQVWFLPSPGRGGSAAKPPGWGEISTAEAAKMPSPPPAAGGVLAAERELDAALLLRRPAFDHRPVALADAAQLEQAAELGQRLPM